MRENTDQNNSEYGQFCCAAYWENFQCEILSIVKQVSLKIRLPYFFKNHLVETISKLNSLGLTKENIEGLNYFERCNVLNSSTVLLARNFQHRVDIFFNEILITRDGSLGKGKYYAI